MKSFFRSAMAAAVVASCVVAGGAVAGETELRVSTDQIEALGPAPQLVVDKSSSQRDPRVAVIVK